MLAGLEDIDEGAIEIGGKDMTGCAVEGPRHRDGVPELRAVPEQDGRREHGLRAQAARASRPTERRKKVEEAAKVLDLTEHLDRKPAKLSGGQRQRVAMGRAIVREPQVFCMDEPLSNLDAKLRVQTRTQIAALQRRLGTTTVYVTHDQVEAMTMGDRVAVLRFGKLQQFAAPNELYDRPANAFVAGFIGSPAMNLVTAADRQRRRAGRRLDVRARTRPADRLQRRGPVRRSPSESGPSNSTSPNPVASRSSSTWSRTSAARPTSTHMRGSGVELVARCNPRTAPKLADTVRLRRHPDGAVHLFHPETGERLN